MEKKENGEVVMTSAEMGQLINKSYVEGATEMTKQLKNLFIANVKSLEATFEQQFENILAQLQKAPNKQDKKD